MARGRAAATGPDAGDEKQAGAEVESPVGGRPTGGATQPMVDLEFVKGLIEAVDASGIDSLEITRAGTRVKISKTPPGVVAAPTYYAAAPAPLPPMAAAPAPWPAAPPPAAPGEAPAAAPSPTEVVAEPGAVSGLTEVASPMVGTFYRAPAPDAPPYVEVGSRVSKGQTLCILEAMKLMNELESEVDGVIREILVENAEPVEYGQVLFRIDPNG